MLCLCVFMHMPEYGREKEKKKNKKAHSQNLLTALLSGKDNGGNIKC